MEAAASQQFAQRLMNIIFEVERRQGSPAASIQACGEELLRQGLEILRISTSIPTLHPEVSGLEVVWFRGEQARTRDLPHDIVTSPDYLASPVAVMDRTRKKVRCHLERDGDFGFSVLRNLMTLGATDYVLLPLPFSNGRLGGISFTTDRPGGFADVALEAFDLSVQVMAVCLELRYMQSSMRSLLRIYLGHNAAARVLAGGFRRGTGESIRAALWYSDMRGFTALSDHLSPKETVTLLDSYFETVAGTIEPHGGEILKFMGDAVLAIFPLVDDNAEHACAQALASARASLEALASFNAERARNGDAPLGMGIALHLGEVMYGNIGVRERLDFTVIGTSVNEAARMEQLCKSLRVPLVMGATFAATLSGVELVSLGSHELRGVAVSQEVFTLATCIAAQIQSAPWPSST